MLELEGVRSGYGKLEIVQAASLQGGDAAIAGIIGPNGAGKSTLLKTASGYLPPSARRIALHGRGVVEGGGGGRADGGAERRGVAGGGGWGVGARPGPQRLRRDAGRAERLRPDPPAVPGRGRGGRRARALMLESLLEFLIQGVVLGGLYALFAVVL